MLSIKLYWQLPISRDLCRVLCLHMYHIVFLSYLAVPARKITSVSNLVQNTSDSCQVIVHLHMVLKVNNSVMGLLLCLFYEITFWKMAQIKAIERTGQCS